MRKVFFATLLGFFVLACGTGREQRQPVSNPTRPRSIQGLRYEEEIFYTKSSLDKMIRWHDDSNRVTCWTWGGTRVGGGISCLPDSAIGRISGKPEVEQGGGK
ncbi:MAG TPA: hypothetical protein VJJ22_02765 [Candidatus Paceibacterota bacterium]